VRLPLDAARRLVVDHAADRILDITLETVAEARRASQALIRSIVALGSSLDLTVVAEGVEDARTAEWLRDGGCEVAQGTLYSPPITATAMMELLASPVRL